MIGHEVDTDSWIAQINDDGGPTADGLNGFRWHAFGVGPILTCTTKIGKNLLDLNSRFIPEFGNEASRTSASANA